MNSFATLCILGTVSAFLFSLGDSAPRLELPERSSEAETGTQLAESLSTLSVTEREQRVLQEIQSGNVPRFLRKMCPVTARATIHARFKKKISRTTPISSPLLNILWIRSTASCITNRNMITESEYTNGRKCSRIICL